MIENWFHILISTFFLQQIWSFTPSPSSQYIRQPLRWKSDNKHGTLHASSIEQFSQTEQTLIHMGISKELNELQRGKSIRKKVNMIQEKEIEIVKIGGQQTPIFHLKGVLSKEECEYIQRISLENETFEKAVTRLGGDDNEKRLNCEVAWLSNFKYEPIATLADSVQSIFLPFEPSPLQLEHLEEMQVVKYNTNGEFKLHHDGARRILTVIYYINGISETWFPLADYGKRIHTYDEAMETISKMIESKDDQIYSKEGVLATSKQNGETPPMIQSGDAIAFYNYFQDASVDFNAMHAGLPCESTKWIGTHWYHHVPRSRPKQ